MSERSARTAENILNNLLKAKDKTRDLQRNIGYAESMLHRVEASASGLMRGDPTALMSLLASFGPTGAAIAALIGLGAIGYGIYQAVTREKPTEIYQWRYPE